VIKFKGFKTNGVASEKDFQTEIEVLHILNSKNRNKSQYFPVLLDYLRHSETNLLIALKFARRGIPLSANVKEIVDKNLISEYGIPLLIHVGVKLTRALQIAHKAKIVHRDIRVANVILLPQDDAECQTAINISDGGICSSAQSMLQAFSLSNSSVMLNDWGRAIMDCSDDVRWRHQDLIDLIENMIVNMFSSVADTEDNALVLLSSQQSEELLEFAKSCKYDQLIKAIQKLSLR
jgi:serine/threonine protein kinase